jgi:phage baseplate assembly protein W
MAFVKGIGFPFQKGTTSFPAEVSDNELIQQSILQILGTSKGERVMRPDFGTNVYALLFEPNDALLEDAVREEVMTAIATFEPRAIIRTVTIERDDNVVTITINYIAVPTQQIQQLEVDFPNPLGAVA